MREEGEVGNKLQDCWEQVRGDHETGSGCYMWPSPVALLACACANQEGPPAWGVPGRFHWGSQMWPRQPCAQGLMPPCPFLHPNPSLKKCSFYMTPSTVGFSRFRIDVGGLVGWFLTKNRHQVPGAVLGLEPSLGFCGVSVMWHFAMALTWRRHRLPCECSGAH